MSLQENLFKSAFSVDNVIFGYSNDKLKVLLIKRADNPFQGQWALPGDLVKTEEDLDDAPLRILKQLTGLDNVYLEQVHTFGKIDRHPKGRVITVAYYSLISMLKVNPVASSFAAEVQWHDVWQINSLAFDHFDIMQACLSQLQRSLKVYPIGFELLDDRFTLSQLQGLYETVMNRQLDKRNFRKKILATHLLKDEQRLQEKVPHRPAKLYKFDKEKYELFKAQGFSFDVI